MHVLSVTAPDPASLPHPVSRLPAASRATLFFPVGKDGKRSEPDIGLMTLVVESFWEDFLFSRWWMGLRIASVSRFASLQCLPSLLGWLQAWWEGLVCLSSLPPWCFFPSSLLMKVSTLSQQVEVGRESKFLLTRSLFRGHLLI